MDAMVWALTDLLITPPGPVRLRVMPRAPWRALCSVDGQRRAWSRRIWRDLPCDEAPAFCCVQGRLGRTTPASPPVTWIRGWRRGEPQGPSPLKHRHRSSRPSHGANRDLRPALIGGVFFARHLRRASKRRLSAAPFCEVAELADFVCAAMGARIYLAPSRPLSARALSPSSQPSWAGLFLSEGPSGPIGGRCPPRTLVRGFRQPPGAYSLAQTIAALASPSQLASVIRRCAERLRRASASAFNCRPGSRSC